MKKLLLFVLAVICVCEVFSAPPDSSAIRKLPKASSLKSDDLFWVSNRREAAGARDSSVKADQINEFLIDQSVELSSVYYGLSGAGDTTGVISRRRGDEYLDTLNNIWYKAKDAGRGKWIKLN